MVQQRKTPKQARSKQRVAKLLSTAEKLLISEGYNSLTTNKVAERADISIASLYQYFPNKESLIYAINQKMLSDVLKDFERYLEMCHSMHWRELFDLMDDEYLIDKNHIKLVRELDHAIYTSQELQQTEAQHYQTVADYYAQILKKYGSSWPESSLLNVGRLLYRRSNDILYYQEHPSEADKQEAIKLHKALTHSLVEKTLSTKGVS